MARKGEAIYKRKDGRYEARFIKGYTNGKADYIFVYGKTYMEAKKKRQQTIENYKLKTNSNKNNITFNKVLDIFIENKKNKIKESSLSTYLVIIENHLRPEFGNLKVDCINEELINNFVMKELNKFSSNVVHDIATLLKQILKVNNIDLKFYIPQKKQKQIVIFTNTETNIIRDNCLIFNDRSRFGIALTLYTGLRIGELCALKKSNFNLSDKQLSVNKTLLRIKSLDNDIDKKTKVVCQSAKTDNSVRIIPTADVLIPYLTMYLEVMKDDDYFLTGKSKFIEPRFYYAKYHKILDKFGIRKHDFHTLRHTFATNAAEKKMDVKALSEILGHSNISITLSLYVHPSINYKRSCINNIFE